MSPAAISITANHRECSYRDWPLLQQAIALKLNEQEDFANWWEGAVTVRQSPGGADRASNAALRSMISKSDAESETGISQQQVSRWRKRQGSRLADRIQARAIRRCGELLKQVEAGKNRFDEHRHDGSDTPINRAAAATQAGLSERQKVTGRGRHRRS